MELTYTDILKSRNLGSVPVLWRLRVTPEEIVGIVAYINKYIGVQYLNAKEKSDLIGREVCLLYSYWWTNEYDGKARSYDDVLNKHGIDTKHKQLIAKIIKYMFTDYRNRLNMTLYRGERQNLYLQSVTAQGGLPMSLFRDPDSLSQYEAFVGKLINEYEEIATVDRDWDDLTLAKEVAKKCIQSKIIRECDEIIENAIEFVKAYLNEDESYFEDNGEIKKIVEHIRATRKQNNITSTFSIQWQFKFYKGDEFKLYYSVKVPHVLGDNETDADMVSFYADDILVGSYQRYGQTFTLVPGTGSSTLRLCSSITDRIKFHVKIFRANDVPEIKPYTLINAEPPFVDEPLLLQWINGSWVPYSNKNSDEYACLYPKNWHSDTLKDEKIVYLSSKEFYFQTFKWEEIGLSSIQFNDNETNETIKLTKGYSDYSVAISSPIDQSIEESTVTLLWECSNLNAIFKKFLNGQKYNGENGRFKICYRMKWEHEYRQYKGEKLLGGPLIVKVEFPDGFVRTFSFFNITGLKYLKHNENTFSLSLAEGLIHLVAGQDNVTKVIGRPNTYQLCNTTTTEALKPVSFILSPNGQPTFSTIVGVKSPHDTTCFLDNKGNILGAKSVISFDELYKYKVNLDAVSDVVLRFIDGRRCMLRQNVKLGKGKTTLDILSESIERMFSIEGFNDYNKEIEVYVDGHRDESSVRIKRHSYKAKTNVKDGIIGVVVIQNGKLVSGLTLYACPVLGVKDLSDVFVMKEDGNGFYYLDGEEAKDVVRCVIFNDNRKSVDTLKPKLLKLDDADGNLDRSKLKAENIAVTTEALLSANQSAWDEVIFHTRLTMRYNLPYLNSFNCFQAIASNPYLQAMFISRLPSFGLKFEKDFIIEELMRMERDLGICFYAIPRKHWQKIKKIEENKYNEQIAENEFVKRQEGCDTFDNYLGAHVLTYLFDLLMAQFNGENAFNIYQKLIYDNQLPISYPVRENIMTQNDCTIYEDFNTPEPLIFPNGLITPPGLRQWSSNMSAWRKHKFLSIVIPQDIALQTLGDADNLWCYSHDEDPIKREETNKVREFKRRMHNYLRRYDRERYNILFCHTLFD